MRGFVCAVLAVVAGLALPATGQNIGGTTTPAAGCKTPSSGNKVTLNQVKPIKPARPTPQPYTAKFKITTVRIKANSTTTSEDGEQLTARDSQGRQLFADTDSSGEAQNIVDDPIAGVRITWNTRNALAKIVKYPEPVPGRRSCWRVAPEESAPVRGEVQVGLNGASCSPAERDHSFYCKRSKDESSVVVGSPSQELPAEEASFSDCKKGIVSVIIRGATDEQDEDLGSETIQGFPTHGCRVTVNVPEGKNISESWITSFGSVSSHVSLSLRNVNEFPAFGDQTIQRTEELISLDTSEPDPTIFALPKGYKIKTIEMHEVPCEEPKPTTASLPAQ